MADASTDPRSPDQLRELSPPSRELDIIIVAVSASKETPRDVGRQVLE